MPHGKVRRHAGAAGVYILGYVSQTSRIVETSVSGSSSHGSNRPQKQIFVLLLDLRPVDLQSCGSHSISGKSPAKNQLVKLWFKMLKLVIQKNEVYGENTINRNWRPTLTRERESLPVHKNFTFEPSNSV